MNFDVVDQSEVRVTFDDESCDITSYTNIMISCVPLQSGVGTVKIVVSCYVAMHVYKQHRVIYLKQVTLKNTQN